MYISPDPPLVLGILTSWQLAWQLVTSPHASAEVGLGSDSNGQSPGQKTNVALIMMFVYSGCDVDPDLT